MMRSIPWIFHVATLNSVLWRWEMKQRALFHVPVCLNWGRSGKKRPTRLGGDGINSLLCLTWTTCTVDYYGVHDDPKYLYSVLPSRSRRRETLTKVATGGVGMQELIGWEAPGTASTSTSIGLRDGNIERGDKACYGAGAAGEGTKRKRGVG